MTLAFLPSFLRSVRPPSRGSTDRPSEERLLSEGQQQDGSPRRRRLPPSLRLYSPSAFPTSCTYPTSLARVDKREASSALQFNFKRTRVRDARAKVFRVKHARVFVNNSTQTNPMAEPRPESAISLILPSQTFRRESRRENNGIEVSKCCLTPNSVHAICQCIFRTHRSTASHFAVDIHCCGVLSSGRRRHCGCGGGDKGLL